MKKKLFLMCLMIAALAIVFTVSAFAEGITVSKTESEEYGTVIQLSADPGLDNAKNYVKAGGRLVYSTCTVLPEENEENVRAFLSDNPEFTLENIMLSGNSFDGMITFTPDNGITDGFFIARMRRTCGK